MELFFHRSVKLDNSTYNLHKTSTGSQTSLIKKLSDCAGKNSYSKFELSCSNYGM